MSNTAIDVIYLASCALRGETPGRALVERMDLDEVYSLAAKHMITAAVAFALESAGFRDEKSGSAIGAAIRKRAIFDRTWAAIKGELEKAGIWYMPLKGAVLKEMYPKYGMREFADHDILFDSSREEEVKAVMEGLGFDAAGLDDNNHECYYKAPYLSFEMHRALFGPAHEEKIYLYYKDVKNRLIQGEGSERKFTPEDAYVYMIAHEYGHYKSRGTGLRSLMDTYIYIKSTDLDMDYVAAEAEKLGLGEFEKRNRSLALRLFSREKITAEEEEMLEYILSSGTFGTFSHQIQNNMREKGWNKPQYVLKRFLIPMRKNDEAYPYFAENYPVFYQNKILLPLLPFYRVFKSFKTGKFKSEWNALHKF